jgi:hypothetical protein
MTSGISAMLARPIISLIRAMPGPEVAVMAFTPAKLAPMAMPALAISSSAWIMVPSKRGRRFSSHSMMSVAGVMG